METKLRNDILKIIKDTDYACELKKLKQALVDNYGHKPQVENYNDIFSSRVHNYLKVLENSGFIISSHGQTGNGFPSSFYSLTQRGYQEFDPWYKKAWRFINDDFAKLLSIISIILSIIATVVSFGK